jgi:hypothetical protein
MTYFVLNGVMVIMLATNPRFVDSNLAKNNVFLRAIKDRSTTSIGGEAKPSALCHKILQNVKNPLTYDRGIDRQNSVAISRHFLSPLYY